MTFPSRTYGYRFNWRGFLPPAMRNIILACTGVFLLQTVVNLFFPSLAPVYLYLLGLVPYGVTHGLRIWQPFTYLFLHGGFMHLLINMFVLWMFGVDLERTWGSRRFYTYYFLCGISAGLITVAVKTILDPHPITATSPAMIPTIGASGAIYGVLLAAAMIFPDRQVMLIPFPVTMPMRVYVLIMGAMEFFFTLGSSGDNISHVCHLGGMLAGYLFLRRGSFLYTFRNYYSDWKRRRLRHKFEVYQREHRDKPPDHPDNWVN